MKTKSLIIIGLLIGVMFVITCSDNPVEETNNAPTKPEINLPAGSPSNSSLNQSIRTTLSWVCIDPDNDKLTYDVYFGTSSNPSKIVSGKSLPSYSPRTLQYGSTYFWKIGAKDSKGATSISDLWSFKTESAPAIETISKPTISNGADSAFINESLTFNTTGSSSSLGHSIQYQFNWDDNNYSGWSNSSTASHQWSNSGNYNISSRVRCATHTSIISNWSSSKSVVISEIKIPELIVSTNSLDFDSTQTSFTFTISNGGDSILSWTITDNQNWISVSPLSGTTKTESDEITITVDRTSLNCGSYSGIISISSNGGTDSINVTMQVNQTGSISISTTSFDFESSLEQLCFTLSNTNCNCGSCSWSIIESCSWLSVTPNAGEINCDPVEICLTVDRNNLNCGSYQCDIILNSSCNQEMTILVEMQVTGSAELSFDPQFLDFGSNLDTMILNIRNLKSDCSTLNWELSTSSTWINIEPLSGSTNSEVDEVILTVDRSNITSHHSGVLVISVDHNSTLEGIPIAVAPASFNCEIDLTSPVSSDVWIKGSQHIIQWNNNSCDSPYVKITLIEHRNPNPMILRGYISNQTANDGSFSWTVDDFGGGTSSNYSIFVNDSIQASFVGYSETFTIKNNNPVTVTLNSTADADISSNYPEINIGTSSTMLVGRITDEGWVASYIKFNELLSNVPANSKIISAEIILTRRYWSGSLTMQVKPAKRNWLESTIIYNTQPGEYDDVVTYTNPVGGSNPTEIIIDVTQHVQEWIDGVRPNYGFSLWPNGTIGLDNVVQFYTKDHSTSSYRPKLRITYQLQ